MFKIEYYNLYKILRIIFYLFLTILIIYLCILYINISLAETSINYTERLTNNKNFLALSPMEIGDLRNRYTMQFNIFNTKKLQLLLEVDRLKNFCNNIEGITYSYINDNLSVSPTPNLTYPERNQLLTNIFGTSNKIVRDTKTLFNVLSYLESIDDAIQDKTGSRTNPVEFYRNNEGVLCKYRDIISICKNCTKFFVDY